MTPNFSERELDQIYRDHTAAIDKIWDTIPEYSLRQAVEAWAVETYYQRIELPNHDARPDHF